MGLLDHLAGLLGGSTDEDGTADSVDSSGAARDRDERRAALVDAGLPDAPYPEIVARASEHPSAYAGRVGDLLRAVQSGSAASADAAVVLATLAEHDPSVVAPHADGLVDTLACEDDRARTHVADALGLVARERSVPADRLVAHVADEDAPCRAEAAVVLGVVAATRPGTMPVERLEALAEGDDVAGAAGQYLLAVLAADHPEIDGEATTDEVVALARAVRDASIDQWLADELTRDAILALVEDVHPDAGCRDARVVHTQTSSDVHLRVENPAAVETEAVRDALADRLGLSDAAVKLDEP